MEEQPNCLWPSGLPNPSQQPERHERRDAREHRQLILEIARQLFAEQGVDAISMQQIAAAAGVGKGTLYRRYAHKGELCMDILRERHERFIRELAELLTSMQDAPALKRLEGVLARTVVLLEEQGALLGAIVRTDLREPHCGEAHFVRHLPPPSSPFFWLFELFTKLLTEAVQHGELAPLDVSYTADAILAALHPAFYHFQRQERGFSQERILQGLCHIYIKGLKAPEHE